MELRRDSRLVKWAYLPEPKGSRIPTQTSVCVLFWRSVLNTPLFCLTVGIVLVVTSPLWVSVWVWEKTTGREFSEVLTRVGEGKAATALVQGAMSIKSRVCPIVTFVEHEESAR